MKGGGETRREHLRTLQRQEDALAGDRVDVTACVADECRATGAGPADAIVCGLVEGGFRGKIRSVRSVDTYIPLGDAANIVLLSEDDIVRATREVLA